jgi:hypothetical protein
VTPKSLPSASISFTTSAAPGANFATLRTSLPVAVLARWYLPVVKALAFFWGCGPWYREISRIRSRKATARLSPKGMVEMASMPPQRTQAFMSGGRSPAY